MRDALLIERAKDARKAPTPAEQKLWFALRAERLADVKFRRQKGDRGVYCRLCGERAEARNRTRRASAWRNGCV
ncbi:DUF559 domain-containing protein [Sphingomonas sp. Leaf25]|uniref:DUF559 domain-containing protein n=1 Tax=Sphingomonas sp. Leaf25 TaxID=1735692 RepID=UPI002285646B|nr:DUF559 domain-containing protein [Sphingomonas sp. Leaf25]